MPRNLKPPIPPQREKRTSGYTRETMPRGIPTESATEKIPPVFRKRRR